MYLYGDSLSPGSGSMAPDTILSWFQTLLNQECCSRGFCWRFYIFLPRFSLTSKSTNSSLNILIITLYSTAVELGDGRRGRVSESLLSKCVCLKIRPKFRFWLTNIAVTAPIYTTHTSCCRLPDHLSYNPLSTYFTQLKPLFLFNFRANHNIYLPTYCR